MVQIYACGGQMVSTPFIAAIAPCARTGLLTVDHSRVPHESLVHLRRMRLQSLADGPTE